MHPRLAVGGQAGERITGNLRVPGGALAETRQGSPGYAQPRAVSQVSARERQRAAERTSARERRNTATAGACSYMQTNTSPCRRRCPCKSSEQRAASSRRACKARRIACWSVGNVSGRVWRRRRLGHIALWLWSSSMSSSSNTAAAFFCSTRRRSMLWRAGFMTGPCQ